MSEAINGSGGRHVHGTPPDLSRTLEVVRRHPWILAGSVLAVLVASLAWAGSRTPAYRASTQILLEQESSSGGVLGELAALTSAPPAASQIAIMQSRSIAEETVRTPVDGALPTSDDSAADARRLGLTTTVEDLGYSPFRVMYRRLVGNGSSSGRVFASLEALSVEGPEEILVEFVEPGRVRLERSAGMPWNSLSEEVDFVPGQSIDWEGVRLHLQTVGNVEHGTFRIRLLPFESAVNRVIDGTKIMEIERNSGIIKLVFEDSDPRRAADTVNALARNYLEHIGKRGARRASRTIEFIQDQLDSQIAQLEQAEGEIVRLQELRPGTINVEATSLSLIEHLSKLEQERIRIAVMHRMLTGSLASLEEGQPDALSRVGGEYLDPISQGYLEQVAMLGSESALQERSDTGAYKLLIQEKLDRLESESEQIATRARALGEIVSGLESGDRNVLARLEMGSLFGLQPDALTSVYVAEIARRTANQKELLLELTPANPRVVAHEEALTDLHERVHAHLASRVDGLQTMQARYAELMGETRALLETHPVAERAKIEAASGRIGDMAVVHLRGRRDGLVSQESALLEEIARMKEQLAELPQEQQALAGPLRRVESHRETVSFLLTSLKEAEIVRASTVTSAEMLDPAVPPRERHSPHMMFAAVIGSLLGLALGIALALLQEARRGTLNSAWELEEATGFPGIGLVPDFQFGGLGKNGGRTAIVALLQQPAGIVAEAYRVIKANISLRTASGERIRTLAVTSSVKGEGKTITNIDMALAYARSGHRVLLVDADMRNPSVHRYLDLKGTPGLYDVLAAKADWKDCTVDSEHPNLKVIPAGKGLESPSDMLASPAVDRLIEEAGEQYDLIVFDVPPILPVADMATLAGKIDAILLLYRSNGVPRAAVASAARTIRQAGARFVGSVLNGVKPRRSAGYGYGYGYGYEGYGSDGNKNGTHN